MDEAWRGLGGHVLGTRLLLAFFFTVGDLTNAQLLLGQLLRLRLCLRLLLRLAERAQSKG